MAIQPQNSQSARHLVGLPGGRQERDQISGDDPRRRNFAQYLPHLALGVTVAVLGVQRAGSAFNSALGSGSSGTGAAPSVGELRNWPHQLTVTPITEQGAHEGASGMGELINPQVYQGSHSSSAATGNLNAEIEGQDAAHVVHVGESFRVPVLDPKDLTTKQISSPDFVVGPAK